MPKWNEKILFVDDDENILHSYKRQLRAVAHVHTAIGGQEGLNKIKEQGPFSVVISDMRMPNMNGAEFLTEVRKISPDSIRIILTGQSDIESAIKAVNDGHVFRFLSKPCSSQDMAEALVSSIKQYRLTVSEHDLLDKTLKGAITVLTEVLSIVNPKIFGQTSRFRNIVNFLIKSLELTNSWDVEVAAMLSSLGYITLPDDLVKKIANKGKLSDDEIELVDNTSNICTELIRNIPRMEIVTKIIEAQNESFVLKSKATELPPDERILLCGHLLKVARYVDRELVGRETLDSVLNKMKKSKGNFDIAVYGYLKEYEIASTEISPVHVDVSKLKTDMVLEQDVHRSDGTLLLSKGYILNPAAILHLSHHVQQGQLEGQVLVSYGN